MGIGRAWDMKIGRFPNSVSIGRRQRANPLKWMTTRLAKW